MRNSERREILNLSTNNILGWVILCCKSRLVHRKICSSNLGFGPSDARGILSALVTTRKFLAITECLLGGEFTLGREPMSDIEATTQTM